MVELRIGRDDAVTDRLQRDLRALLLAEQRLFVELALGDVELDAHQAQQAAVLVDARRARGSPPSATRRCDGACDAVLSKIGVLPAT